MPWAIHYVLNQRSNIPQHNPEIRRHEQQPAAISGAPSNLPRGRARWASPRGHLSLRLFGVRPAGGAPAGNERGDDRRTGNGVRDTPRHGQQPQTVRCGGRGDVVCARL